MPEEQHPVGSLRWAWNGYHQRRELAEIVAINAAGRFSLRWPDGRVTTGHFCSSLSDQNLDNRVPIGGSN